MPSPSYGARRRSGKPWFTVHANFGGPKIRIDAGAVQAIEKDPSGFAGALIHLRGRKDPLEVGEGAGEVERLVDEALADERLRAA
jgi:hypothetical protein